MANKLPISKLTQFIFIIFLLNFKFVTGNNRSELIRMQYAGQIVESAFSRQMSSLLPTFSARVWGQLQHVKREIKSDLRKVLLLLEEHAGVGGQETVYGQPLPGHKPTNSNPTELEDDVISGLHDNITSTLVDMERRMSAALDSVSKNCDRSIEENNVLMLSQQGAILRSLELINAKLDGAAATEKMQAEEPVPPTRNMGRDTPRDCADARSVGSDTSNLTIILPGDGINLQPKRVQCDQDTDGGGWLVILHRMRQEPQENFRRDWLSYQEGFGDPAGEHWIGLDTLHSLTKATNYQLRVDVSIGREKAHSVYGTFRVGPGLANRKGYRLTVSDFDEEKSTAGDALSYHNGMDFTTYDSDNDFAKGDSCSIWCGGGGWWYNYCFYTNPTGVYPPGSLPRTTEANVYLEWRNWQGYYAYLSSITFKIRPHE